MTVAARIVALGDQVIPCAGVVHLIAFLHFFDAAAISVVEFARVSIYDIICARRRSIVLYDFLCGRWGSDHNAARCHNIFLAG